MLVASTAHSSLHLRVKILRNDVEANKSGNMWPREVGGVAMGDLLIINCRALNIRRKNKQEHTVSVLKLKVSYCAQSSFTSISCNLLYMLQNQ